MLSHREEIIRKDLHLTPPMCLKLLEVSKPDFLTIIGKTVGKWESHEVQLSNPECLFVVFSLCALVQLKHLQRPGVVEGITVSVVVLQISSMFLNSF